MKCKKSERIGQIKMSKLNIKKITALASAAAVMASMTACGQNTTWGADIDGTQIPAGVFIYYLQSAYYEAQSKVGTAEDTASGISPDAAAAETAAAQTDLFVSQIDGKNAKDWIYDEATKSMQEYAAVEAKFEEYGLSVSDEAEESAELYCAQLWDYYGEIYTDMGISEKSYLSIFLNGEKRNMLFEALYGEGGEMSVSDDEIKAYLDENYSMINYIDMELRDGEGNLLKSEGKAEIRAMAEEYIERYKGGEDFDALNAEYTAYYEKLKADAAAAAAETADNDGGLTAEVEQSPAEAPLIADGDTLTENETPAETSVSEPAQTQAPAETTVTTAVETEAAETTADTAVDAEGNAEGTAEADTGIASVATNRTIIGKEETTPSAEVAEAVFGTMNKGDIQIIETADGEHYYVVVKLDILETDEYFDSAKESLLYEMKSEEYEALVSGWTETQSVSRNADAYDRYDPEKIFNYE